MKLKRRWENVCEHTDREYVGTFNVFYSQAPGAPTLEETYDVYALSTGGICLRFGNEGSEYLSHTTIVTLAQASALSTSPVYLEACNLLLQKGRFVWDWHKK